MHERRLNLGLTFLCPFVMLAYEWLFVIIYVNHKIVANMQVS